MKQRVGCLPWLIYIQVVLLGYFRNLARSKHNGIARIGVQAGQCGRDIAVQRFQRLRVGYGSSGGLQEIHYFVEGTDEYVWGYNPKHVPEALAKMFMDTAKLDVEEGEEGHEGNRRRGK